MRQAPKIQGKLVDRQGPDRIECRKECRNGGDYYWQGSFCGYASSLHGCIAACAHITCPEDQGIGGTGEPVAFRKQSGSDSSGKILGLTTQQALIAVGVGVAAYFIIKKVK